MSAVSYAARPATKAKSRMITVVIVEDYAPLCALYERVLAGEPTIHCLAKAASGKEALRMVRKLRPDVILLDISLPDANGLHVARRIKTLCPAVQIVMLGGDGSEDYRLAARASGASGYLRKEQTIEQLVPLIFDLAGQSN